MPPVTGTAIVNAATQLRIINLDQVLDTNISTSMNFAIDFANQTFRITGLQFSDWLTANMDFAAVNVSFDNSLFVVEFPAEPTPPDTVQEVIDFGLPILANADAGAIGKTSSLNVLDFNTVTINSFIVSNATIPNSPTDYTMGLNVQKSAGESAQLVFGILSKKAYYRVQSNSFEPWRTLADTEDLAAYLPLSGGTLSGDNEILILKSPSLGAEASQHIALKDSDGTLSGSIGHITSLNNDFYVSSNTDNLILSADNGTINLTAPTTNVSGVLQLAGQAKGITPVAAEDLTRKDYVDARAPTITSGATATGGWVKQGNFYREWGLSPAIQSEGTAVITLTSAFADATYGIALSADLGAAAPVGESMFYKSKTAAGFTIQCAWGAVGIPVAWSVEGFV